MTTREAWKAVEFILTDNVSFLPLHTDDNSEPFTVPDTGAIVLGLQSGSETHYASPGADSETLVFSFEIYCPASTGNGTCQDYATFIRNLYSGKTLLNPTSGQPGVLICKRTQSDIIGRTRDGRNLYQINAIAVFDNISYK